MEKRNEISVLSFRFVLQIIPYCELLEEKRKCVIARQLLKSGISIGATVQEAQNAENNQEFIHKLKIVAKEADEAEYWLLLCEKLLNYPTTKDLITSIISIRKLLNSIISTAKNEKYSKFRKNTILN